jgi:hypothetical protein
MLKPGTFQLNKNLDEFLSQFRNNFHHPRLEPKGKWPGMTASNFVIADVVPPA